MAKNISLLGASYPDVPAVTLPQTEGGSALFTDVSDTTALAKSVETGKAFYDAFGVKTLGVMRNGYPVSTDGHVDGQGHWIRPQEYPNLDALYDSIGNGESCVYLTYDLRKTAGYGWIGIFVLSSVDTNYVERGHIENGVFVADSSIQLVSGNYFRQSLDSQYGDIQIWRVISTGNMTRCAFATNSNTSAECMYPTMQPCVERVGKLPYVTNVASGHDTTYNSTSFGTVWLERDRLYISSHSSVTSLGSTYSYCRNLIETNCGEWDTSNWNVNNLSYMFFMCESIVNLDLSGWDTSGWHVTSFAQTWYNCFSLRQLKVSWNTSNWAVTNFTQPWFFCLSLQELDLSDWDTSSWAVASLESAWQGNYSLKKLDVSTWDTSNWVVATLKNTWNSCYALVELDLNNWDTSNWTVNSLYQTWYNCYSLRCLHIEDLDTSNWKVTTMQQTWYYCFSLEALRLNEWDTSEWAVTTLQQTWCLCPALTTLEISNWDTSSWKVTSLYSPWGSCMSLQELDLSRWDTSKWVVTSLQQMFGTCTSLRVLKIGTWDTSNWAVNNCTYTFTNCVNLKEMDLTHWDTSNWVVTSTYCMFYNCYGINLIDMSTWDTSNWALTDTREMFSNNSAVTIKLPVGFHGSVNNSKASVSVGYRLVTLHPPAVDRPQNISYSEVLSRESLLYIFNNLPTISTATTITLGKANKLKLTAAEIAIATQKGWTVA